MSTGLGALDSWTGGWEKMPAGAGRYVLACVASVTVKNMFYSIKSFLV